MSAREQKVCEFGGESALHEVHNLAPSRAHWRRAEPGLGCRHEGRPDTRVNLGEAWLSARESRLGRSGFRRERVCLAGWGRWGKAPEVCRCRRRPAGAAAVCSGDGFECRVAGQRVGDFGSWSR